MSCDCRSTNDDRAVPADASGTIDATRTDGRLSVIGTRCHRENGRADCDSDCHHSHVMSLLYRSRIFMEQDD
jgi:hypothetical protein